MNVKIITLVFFLCLPTLSWSWNFDAHHVIGEIAYQNLTPKAKHRSMMLLNTLVPHYHKTSFSQAASWADRIRFHDINAFSSWHYIDTPIIKDGINAPPVSPQNIVWAIHQAEQILKSSRANNLEKSLFLRFLIHLVGDIHQPLHCASLYSQTFQHGDRGGNLFSVTYQGQRNNLHVVWDRGGGLLSEHISHKRGHYRESVGKLAKLLQQKYPKQKYANLMNTTAEVWAKESYDLAGSVAYKIKPEQKLSSTYLNQVQSTAAKQMTLAGYRLAARLNELFA